MTQIGPFDVGLSKSQENRFRCVGFQRSKQIVRVVCDDKTAYSTGALTFL